MKQPIKLASISLLVGVLAWSVGNTGCTPEEIEQVVTTLYELGYQQTDVVENVPVTTTQGLPDVASLPASKDLTSYFPPIGNQGRYGTCVAWATGYNMMSTIRGMKRGLSSSAMADRSNQISPLDLFVAIPDAKKGSNCGGTNFESALDVMQQRGVASMATAPYGTTINCSSSSMQTAWSADAPNNKIKYWRKIDPTANSIKQHIANNMPVMIGAKLADNFMTWNSDAVLSSNTTYNQVGQHAGHALIISGYDNSKGANGAFKVVNSWGTSWGSRGYIWVDYNFMINEFVQQSGGGKPIFIAALDNAGGGTTPPVVNPTAGGVDLAAWVQSDIQDPDPNTSSQHRLVTHNLYNVGTVTATPAKDWSIVYLYYNAYDATKYGIIFTDKFNTTIAAGTVENTSGNDFTLNKSIPAGSALSNVIDPSNPTATAVVQDYEMPHDLTGKYYLVMVGDASDKFEEKDEENNLFYTTDEPITFNNGVAPRSANYEKPWGFTNTLQPSLLNLKQNPYRTAVNAKNHNAYTPEEIIENLKAEARNGNLDKKVKAFVQSNKSKKQHSLKAVK
jgi:C1A family cysteine protease